MKHTNSYHISCAAGLEYALVLECEHLGITGASIESTGRIHAKLTLEQLYTLCLWSRVASRVLLPLFSEPLKTQSGLEPDVAEQLYLVARDFDWSLVFCNTQTFVVRLAADKALRVNQQFATLRVKDAISDSFVDATGSRPSVDKNAQHSIQVNVSKNKAGKFDLAFYLDLTGTSLHRRGYRHAMTDAPLKENLAAALLYHTGWHSARASQRFNALFDPMCGSGTLLIEALLMWTDYAVGSDKRFGFEHWSMHDAVLWQSLKQAAQERHAQALEQPLPKLVGFDASLKAIQATHKNLIAAGFKDWLADITIEKRSLAEWSSTHVSQFADSNTLIITNPPYGERLGDADSIQALYQGLGISLQSCFAGAHAAVVAAHIEDADTLPLTNTDTLRTHNGQLTIYMRQGRILPAQTSALIHTWQKQPIDFANAQDLVNRLQKNLSKLKKPAKKAHVVNLRIYDADLPNYNLAVDVYGEYVHVQEYAAPKKIDPEKAKHNFNTALQAIRLVLGVERDRVFIKTRRIQKGREQYEKRGQKGKFFIATEAGARFFINLTDYLDTGLFLDHRPLRTRLQSEVQGKRVLNLYAYTCSVSVHAALGGAASVVSVDLSANYLSWGKRNFALNGLVVDDKGYQFIEADVFDWLKNCTDKFDVIVIDPPTFSNSKKFYGTFDVQRDHAALIKRAINRLHTGGVVYFSNNNQKFTLDDELKHKFNVENITEQTIGFDFQNKGNKKIHQAWRIFYQTQQTDA